MKTAGRNKLFLENFFVYGVFGALEKAIPIIMLPIITRLIVDTAEYGVYTMFNTIQSFGIQLAILGLYDATFREYFEKDDVTRKTSVLSTALRIVLLSSIAIGVIVVLFRNTISLVFIGDNAYTIIIYMAAIGIFSGAVRSIFTLPTRIRNKRAVFIISSLLQVSLGYAIAIILIKGFSLNYLSLIYSSLITSVMLLVFYIVLNRGFFKTNKYDRDIANSLLKIGLPLSLTFLVYWVFSSVDKIMITHILGLGQTGIFSIGLKVASVSHIIYVAFGGGWQYFAFKTMRDEDQVEMTSKVLERLAALSVVLMLVASTLDKWVFSFVFDGLYETGYIVFPFLFLAPLSLMVYQVGANQFLVHKKSIYSTISLVSGAAINVVLNYLFISWYGIKGAALATLIGYLSSILIMILINVRNRWLMLSRRLFVVSMIMIVVLLRIFIRDDTYSILYAIVGILVLFALYFKDIRVSAASLLTHLRHRKQGGNNTNVDQQD